MEDSWIFESPDGGKTVTKRKPQEDEKWVLVSEETDKTWEPITSIVEVFRQQAIEHQLREKHPPLQEAWEQYQLLLSLYQSENPADK